MPYEHFSPRLGKNFLINDKFISFFSFLSVHAAGQKILVEESKFLLPGHIWFWACCC